MDPRRFRYGTLVLLAVALWAFSYRLGAMPLLDDPNEAEYAEVAREMVESGDWISPRLNYVLFLNKPPLTYWLIGVSDLAFGVNEFSARFPIALAGVLVLLLLVYIGRQIYDAHTGLLAGFVLLASTGFFFETHEVRPDLVLTAGVVGSIAAFARLRQVTPAQMRWPLIALQISLAMGVLAKGLLGIVIPCLVFAVVLVLERRFDLMRVLLHPRAWWLCALLTVPWHAVAAIRHPGFLWDYFINQHLLFFFDRKLPRDSVPVSLPVFWGTFGLRVFPWTLFAPLAVAAALWRMRLRQDSRGDHLVLTWAAVVLLFFSTASSRMEHYSIPVLPAFALLIAKLFRDYARGETWALPNLTRAHIVVFAAVAALGPLIIPWLIEGKTWLAPMGDLSDLARLTSGVLAAGALAAAVAAVSERRGWVVPALVTSMVIAIPLFHRGLTLMSRVASSAGMAAAISAVADPEESVVYEAPTEYQTCAGLNFYMRRRLTLVQPPGFIPPTYLTPHMDELFITRSQLERLWREQRVFLITDPLVPRARLDGSMPEPFYVVARLHDWWAVTNRPVH
jgi:4-amino-4-deoxy-L-arabinose transferase-like glycosyltransferase